MTAHLSREQELVFWRERTERLRARAMAVARKAKPTDAAFLRNLEGTLNEWTSEADEEAARESIKKLLHKTRGSMKLGKIPEDIDAEIRIMRDGWERTWE